MPELQDIIKQKTKEFSELISASLTKQEFLNLAKQLIEHLKKLEKDLNGRVDNKMSDLEELKKIWINDAGCV